MIDEYLKPLQTWQIYACSNNCSFYHTYRTIFWSSCCRKGKTKKSVIKKYSNETVNNKYREKSVTYTNQRISDLSSGGNPSKGLVAYYHGIEQLNEDYVDFELKFFRELHKGRKLWWELNKISNRTDNAYKPVTHTIFEINDENAPSLESNFTNEMMLKYGQTTRKIHGTLKTTLVNWRWQ